MPLSKYVFTLDEEVRKYCEETLNETEESRRSSLDALTQWINENPHLHIKPHETSLLPFLRGCKFNLDRTKDKLKNYSSLRSDAPEWFTNRDPSLPEIQEMIKLGVFIPLRKLLDDKQMIVIIRTSVHDPKKHDINNVFKAGKMMLDVAARETEKAQIYGITAIFDMEGTSMSHARQLSPGVIKKAVYSWQNYHCRPKQLKFINGPIYINVVLNVFKSFMTDKLKRRVEVLFNGLDSLHQVVPRDILPVEYGGSEGQVNDIVGYWYQKLLQYSDWFKEEEQCTISH